MDQGQNLVGGESYPLAAREGQGLRSRTWGFRLVYHGGGWNLAVPAVEGGSLRRRYPG